MTIHSDSPIVHYFGKHLSEEQVQDALIRAEKLVLTAPLDQGQGYEFWKRQRDEWLNEYGSIDWKNRCDRIHR